MKQIKHQSKIIAEYHKYFLENSWQMILNIFMN